MREVKWYFTHPKWTASLFDRKCLKSFLAKNMFPRKCRCSVCGKKFHNYEYIGPYSPLGEKHDVALGGRPGGCPYCKSVDKYRWLWYILSNYTDIEKMNGSVLHFAPEKEIKDKILRNKNLKYITGDIEACKAEYIVDMTDMQFEDNTFDLVIASMVLEHIPDEKAALSELRRVLKASGKIVLTIPVAFDLKETLEDDRVDTDEKRLKYYGQEDHVRLYGRDFKERFSEIGFHIDVYLSGEMLTEKENRRLGYMKNMPVLICTKV